MAVTLNDSICGSGTTGAAVWGKIVGEASAQADLPKYDMLSGLIASEVAVTGAATAALGAMHVCSGTSADYTVALPAASGNAGKLIGFRMSSGLTKLVTLDGSGAETIDGSATRIMWAGESAILLCDGGGWTKIAGKSIPMIAKMSMSTNVTMTASSTTKILYNTVDLQCNGMADTDNSKFIVRRPGKYRWCPRLVFLYTNATACTTMLNAFKNATQITDIFFQYALPGNNLLASPNEIFVLAAGDVIENKCRFSGGSYTDNKATEAGALYNNCTMEEIITW